jgi:hypothetical protein
MSPDPFLVELQSPEFDVQENAPLAQFTVQLSAAPPEIDFC